VTIVELYTGLTVGTVDLQPSNLRRLVEVDYHGKAYKVINQKTGFNAGQPVATLWVEPKAAPVVKAKPAKEDAKPAKRNGKETAKRGARR
jgi:hypothetical protein